MNAQGDVIRIVKTNERNGHIQFHGIITILQCNFINIKQKALFKNNNHK
jgi:hypothetical protein